jgi:hypothetical protein
VAQELEPGVFAVAFARLSADGVRATGKALTVLAYVVEKQAKINVSTGSHRYGTPTPASPGAGPAVVSGNLRRSVTHERVARDAGGTWVTRVGPARGFFPPYPHRGRGGGAPKRTSADRYGYFLETGLRNGAKYPWLKPAAEFAGRTAAPAVIAAFAAGTWGRGG